MQRHRQTSRYGPDEREDAGRGPYRPDEDARRSGRDEFVSGGMEDDDDRRTSYGEPWPERHPGQMGAHPRRSRDSWSERQSGPYRSASSGRSLSEDQYRQESRYYRSEPYTGFAGRVSEYGYEDPSWAPPSASGGVGNQPGSGLREDYRGRGPKQYARSDERIKEDVCDELSDDRFCDARDIEVDVTDGKVTLSGSVPSRYMKHRAEDIADSARGVKDIENRIRVERRESSEGGSSASGARYTVSEDGGFLEEEASKPQSAWQRDD